MNNLALLTTHMNQRGIVANMIYEPCLDLDSKQIREVVNIITRRGNKCTYTSYLCEETFVSVRLAHE